MKKKLPIYSAFGLLAFALFLLLSAGCNSRAKKAAEYNDRIVAVQTNLVKSLNQLDSVINADDLDQARQHLTDFRGDVKDAMRQLDSIGDFDGDTDFKEATHRLFITYDELASDDYNQLIGLLALPDTLFSPEVQKEAFQIEETLISEIKRAHSRFEEDQKLFGKRYRLSFSKNQ